MPLSFRKLCIVLFAIFLLLVIMLFLAVFFINRGYVDYQAKRLYNDARLTCSDPFSSTLYEENLALRLEEIDRNIFKAETEKNKIFWEKIKARSLAVELHVATQTCENAVMSYHEYILEFGRRAIFDSETINFQTNWKYNLIQDCSRLTIDRRAMRFRNIRTPISQAAQGHASTDLDVLQKVSLEKLEKQPRKVKFEQRFCQ